MSKTTVNVSEQLITSIFVGFLLGLVVVVVGHLSPKNWGAFPLSLPGKADSRGHLSIPITTPIGQCDYECMFGQRHNVDCSGKNMGDYSSTSPTAGEIFSAGVEHMSLILIIGLIASTIIYIIKRVSFQVVKE